MIDCTLCEYCRVVDVNVEVEEDGHSVTKWVCSAYCKMIDAFLYDPVNSEMNSSLFRLAYTELKQKPYPNECKYYSVNEKELELRQNNKE